MKRKSSGRDRLKEATTEKCDKKNNTEKKKKEKKKTTAERLEKIINVRRFDKNAAEYQVTASIKHFGTHFGSWLATLARLIPC